MRICRIFLASSAELHHERDLATAAIADFVSLHPEHKVSFEVIKWENFASTFDDARKQNEYNTSIPTCDIFMMLFWTKVGKYTLEEYEIASESLKTNKKPLLLLLEKLDGADKQDSVADFKTKVPHGNGLFSATFKDDDSLKARIKEELQKLFKDGFLKKGEPATLLSANAAADPHVFVGRDKELKEIRERLDKSGKLMLINAEGGIGKTTLAAKYWNESLHEYKHNAWLFCEHGIVNAIKELAPKLNIDLAGMDEDQQLKALKKALSDVHDDFLLVLDNANDDEDIRVFRQEFEGFHWHVLITSRCQGVLDKEQELPITHLPPPLAKALFERYYKEDTADFEALLEGLLKKLNYHTLSIELFAKTLKELAERGETMKHFVSKLENEGILLGKRAKDIKTDYTHHTQIAGRNSDEILANFYNFTHLATNENLRYYLVNMAFLPAEEYDFVFLCELFNQDPIEFEALHQLATKGWLSKNGQKFKINPIIQEIAFHKNKESLGTDAQALLDRLNDILDTDAYNLLNISLTAAAPYIKLLPQLNRSLAKTSSRDMAIVNFKAVIYYTNIGDLVNASYCAEQFGIIYQNLLDTAPDNLEYKNGLAISYAKLGGNYEATGDWKNALLNYQEYNRIQSENVKSSPETLEFKNGLAISYSKLGGIYEATGDWKNAFLNYQEYNRIQSENVKSSPETLEYKNGLAISYSKLGGIYEATGDWKNAFLNYQEFNRIQSENVKSSPETLEYKNGLAISYAKLGGIYEATGDWKNALLNYQESQRLYREVYESSPENLYYKNCLAISYERLGGIYEATGDWKNALLNYQEYNRLEKEITESSPENLSYKNGLAISCQNLGNIYNATGDWKNALLNYQDDFRITKEIYESSPENLSYKNGLAISYFKLGHLYEKVEINKAIENLEFSVSLYQELVSSAPEIVHFSRNYGIIKEYLNALKNG